MGKGPGTSSPKKIFNQDKQEFAQAECESFLRMPKGQAEIQVFFAEPWVYLYSQLNGNGCH